MSLHRIGGRVFLDTSIPIDVASRRIPPEEWRSVWKYIACRYDYTISPMTLGEIMVGVARGGEQHFEKNREALRVLYPTHKKSFLRMPGLFVLEKVLGDHIENSGLEPPDFQIQIQVTLAAMNKNALERGAVTLRHTPDVVRGVRLRGIDESIQRGKEHFAKRLEQLRAGVLDVPTPEYSVKLWMEILGKNATDEECSRVVAALDAAYRHEQTLYTLARQGGYDFSNHASDWIDGQQLFYLCDPTIHFIVRDSRIKRWTAGSDQADRIILYEDLKSLAMKAGSSGQPSRFSSVGGLV